MRKLLLASALGVLSCFSIGHAQTADTPKLTQWGVKLAEVVTPTCSTTVTIDQPTFAANVQDMVDSDIFSKKVSPTLGNVAPHYLMNVFEAETAPYIVRSLFMRNPDVNTCHFVFQYVNPDDYGNDVTHRMLSFDFTRVIFQKVNWDRFNIDNLRKISPNFKGDPGFAALLKDESIAAMMDLKSNE